MEEVTMDWREIMVEEGAEALFDAVAFQGLTQECLLSLAKKGRWFLACTHFGFDIPLNRVPHFDARLTQVMYSYGTVIKKCVWSHLYVRATQVRV